MSPSEKQIFLNLTPVQLMALIVLGESEGEPWDGKLGVAFVIRNRADLWKQTVPEVCLANNQFSCVNDGNARLPTLVDIARNFVGSDHPMLSDCCSAARVAFVKEQPSNIGVSTFYRVTGAPSPWFESEIKAGKLKYCCEIGKQTWYEETRFLNKEA